MTFPNCDIPVCLTHFFMCEFWSGCVGSPKNSSISDNRKLFWERRCSEEEATQSKCNDDWIRSEFLFHTGVLLENCGKLRSFKLQKNKRTFRKLKPGEDFQSLVWTRLKPEAQTGLERLWWRGCTVHPAWDVRATSPTDNHHSHTKAMASTEGQSYPHVRKEEAEGGGRSCDRELSKTNLCRRRTKQTTLAEHS